MKSITINLYNIEELSNEALKQTFIANEYLFTEDGKMADRLLNLAI